MINPTRLKIAMASLTALAALQSAPAAAQEQYLGQIMCAGFNFTPRGWAALNGQILPIAQNTALFSLLGTTYGGNGQTTFALPNMQGRNMMHVGTGPGLTPRQLGETGGTETTTLLASNMPAHSHTVTPLGSTNDATSVSPAGKVAASKARTTLYAEPTNIVNMQASTTSVVGGGQPFNNVQPYLTVNCFIALTGIFPSRE